MSYGLGYFFQYLDFTARASVGFYILAAQSDLIAECRPPDDAGTDNACDTNASEVVPKAVKSPDLRGSSLMLPRPPHRPHILSDSRRVARVYAQAHRQQPRPFPG